MKTCPKCNTQVDSSHMFCMECGYRFEEQTQDVEHVSTEKLPANDMTEVENHVMWNVQPGQVAKLISEKEFTQYSDASGLIINDGARVLIRHNAEEYTQLSNGVYTFPKSESETKSAFGFVRKLVNASGRGKEVPMDFYSIMLVRDGDFPVIFGSLESTGDNFVPMTIPAKNLDVQIGVSAMLRISSMQVFAAKYMLDRNNITNLDLVQLLTPKIEGVLRSVLAEVTVSENGIPETVKTEISERLKALGAELGGVSISSVEEIRIGNEALERFRALNSELYLTGRELEFLERTNEFKNRLAAVQNAQQIDEAKNDLSLMRTLQQINQDKLLAEDELEKFYTVLSREKKIREAQDEEQIAAALADIERTGLIRNEDLNRLKDDIRSSEHKRGHAFRMMQKKDELELESLQREYEKRIREEDYEFEKKKKDDEFERLKELERLRNDKQAAEHERNMEAMKEMQRAKLEKLKMSKDLTPEQLMAIAANENLSSEAAAKFAESLGKGRDAEAERRHQEEIQRLTQARIEDMKDMSKTEHDTVKELIRSMAPNSGAPQYPQYPPQYPQYPPQYPQYQPQYPQQQPQYYQQPPQYPQQAQYPQQPSQQYPASANPGTQAAAGTRFCPACGNRCEAEARFCMACGRPMNC